MGDNLPALVPGFKPPAMPTFETFSRVLAIKRYESGAIDWNVYTATDRLIPIDRCNAILAELEAANVPATKAQAAAAATFLIGAYRAADLNDPRIFTRILAVTLQEYPAEIAISAVDDLTRTSKWLPSRAELIEACEKRMDERHYAKHVVKKHLEEHAEIERWREERKRWLAMRAEHYDENPHHRVIDRWWQMFPPYRQNRETWEWRLKRLIEEFGEAAVDGWHRELPADDVGTESRLQASFHRLSQAARATAAAAGGRV
jgi:hypothetical protein